MSQESVSLSLFGVSLEKERRSFTRFFFLAVFPVFIALILFLAAVSSAFASVPSVQVGLDRLEEGTFLSALQGKRIGLVSHSVSQTSARASQPKTHAIDWIRGSLKLDLRVLFAPEHGLRSVEDESGVDGIDEVTGLPVISLYQVTKRALDLQDWALIDVLLVDLQDAGVRYYTYPSTIALLIDSLQAARKIDPSKEIWILDRPNPLGGEKVEGSRLEAGLARQFISFYEIPTRHGMTVGEIARMYVEKMGYEPPGSSSGLRVVQMQDWDRTMLFSDTGLDWVPPSPALVKSEQALLYSIFGPMEAFDLSVGRGKANDHAFRRFGAPWITSLEATQLADRLNVQMKASTKTSELSFAPIRWDVTRATHQGLQATGVEVALGDFNKIQTREAAIAVAAIFSEIFGSRLAPNAWAPRYWGSQSLLDSILNPTSTSLKSLSDWDSEIQKEEAAFLIERRPFLIY